MKSNAERLERAWKDVRRVMGEQMENPIIHVHLSIAAEHVRRAAQLSQGDPKPEPLSFCELVEDEWYALTKGELNISPEYENDTAYDRTLADLVNSLGMYGETFAATTAADQQDGNNQPIDGDVPRQEMARRAAYALYIVMYGGR